MDTVGPMTRSVADAAIVLSIISGKDERDEFTLAQPSVVPDYTTALNRLAFKNKRIGVPRYKFLENHPFVHSAFEQALKVIKDLGATVVDPANLPSADEIIARKSIKNEKIVLRTDFKVWSLFLSSLSPLNFLFRFNLLII